MIEPETSSKKVKTASNIRENKKEKQEGHARKETRDKKGPRMETSSKQSNPPSNTEETITDKNCKN